MTETSPNSSNPTCTSFDGSLYGILNVSIALIIECMAMKMFWYTSLTKPRLSSSVYPAPWMIRICLMNVDFPDSPVPANRKMKLDCKVRRASAARHSPHSHRANLGTLFELIWGEGELRMCLRSGQKWHFQKTSKTATCSSDIFSENKKVVQSEHRNDLWKSEYFAASIPQWQPGLVTLGGNWTWAYWP